MDTTTRGVIYMVIGCLLLTVSDAVMKWVTQAYPVGQSVFIRGCFLLLPLLLIAWREGRVRGLKVQRLGLQLLRGITSVISVFLFVTSLSYLPLAEAIAITFAAPLIVTAVAPLMLGEPVGWRRRMAVVFGFAGVVLMVRPGADSFRWVALLPLAVAVFEASRDLMTRRMVRTESTAATILITGGLVTIAAFPVALTHWQALTAQALFVFAAAGTCMGVAQCFMMEAFRHGDAALISPFRYSAMVWAVAVGVIAFGEWPDTLTGAGATVVLASGLYIVHRERVQVASN